MNQTPRVAAVHDMSGLGRCSLSVVLPVLSVMGAQCCPLQTAYLSAHTAFPPSARAAFLDMTDVMEQTIGHWEELGTRFDAVYSGFLGSERQIVCLQDFISRVRGSETLVLVDPVMADHGKVYRTYTPEMCREMEVLTAGADLITPNLTEAALLLGERYDDVPQTQAGIHAWLRRLSRNGRRSVVLTGVSFSAGRVGACCLDREGGEISFYEQIQEPGIFSGTGDLFAAVTLGALLRGESLARAVERATCFTHDCVARTLALQTPVLDGVHFEGLLGRLALDGA